MQHEAEAPPPPIGAAGGCVPGAAVAMADCPRDAADPAQDPRAALLAAHERLRAAEDRFRALAATSGEILWTADAGGRLSGDVGPWCAFTGQDDATARERGWAEAIHPDDRAHVAEAWARAVDERRGYEDEMRVRRRDGVYRHLLVRATPIVDPGGIREWVGTSTDITERRALEDRLRAANTELVVASLEAATRAGRLETMFESLADGLLVYDADGRIIRMNGALRRLLALDRDPMYDERPAAERAALVHVRDANGRPIDLDEWSVTRILRGETLTDAAMVSMIVRALDGRDLYMSVSGAPIRDDAGNVIGGIQIMRDVTERRRHEEERAHILGVVSHELRTPLASLKARVQLARRAEEAEEAEQAVADGAGEPVGMAAMRREHLEKIEREARRMERLINDLLDASRMESGALELHLQRRDLVALCRASAEEQAAASGRPIALELPAEPIPAEVDGDRMEQILLNLLANALKFAPPDRPVRLSLRREDTVARIAVCDEGPGIAPDDLARVFERFYRAPGADASSSNGAAGGLGLGLYITRGLVERHGGAITVESVPGHGATFSFTLPLALPA
jgi:PAS domain S-box-containing protein